jgi:hypothetical protein
MGADGTKFHRRRYRREYTKGGFMPINRNVLLLAVAVLCVAIGVLGYKVYEDNREPKGVQINLGPGGITVDKK